MSSLRRTDGQCQVLSDRVFEFGELECFEHGWTEEAQEEEVMNKARCPLCGALGVSMGFANINPSNNPQYFLCPSCGTTFMEER